MRKQNVSLQICVLAKEVVMEQATDTVLSTEERRRHCLEAAERSSKPRGLSQ